MSLHFEIAEFSLRKNRLCELMAENELDGILLFWLNSGMVVTLLVTCYYAYVMFFRLNIVCMGCLRIYLANLMMAAALLAYQFN